MRVRRAVDLSIDRGRIVAAALAGFATAASGPVAPESPFALPGAVTRTPGARPTRCSMQRGGIAAADGMRARGGKPMVIELPYGWKR